jgi:hypothetical protein
MKRLLPFLLAALLAGCTLPAAVVPETSESNPVGESEPANPALARERVMLACRVDGSGCARTGVVTDGIRVERMRTAQGWTMAATSECRGGVCYVMDESGAEWTIEP